MDHIWEDVYLPPMAFAGATSNHQQTFDPKAWLLSLVKWNQTNRTCLHQTNPEPRTQQVPTVHNTVSSESNQSKFYEYLATGKIGEELLPDAPVWQRYQEEAKEYDRELVSGKNQNLDMMLLFATLFSAVLSAFLIDSKRSLQQDPADASLKLLLFIAQSQQRIEQSSPQKIPLPVELPKFSAPMSARWINGLWFLSLALSLSAALLAMLAKEWLSAFTASPPRPARAYALLRQSRLVGLTEWRALLMIDLLPSMLHLSLLLFSLGLVLYLWALDSSIAVVIAIVTGATLLFYAVTVFFGAAYKFCPFVTGLSKLCHQLLNICTRGRMERKEFAKIHTKCQSHDTTNEDLRALSWLAENTRDPTIVDCICLSLAGLRLPTTETEKIVDEGFCSRVSTAPADLGAIPSGDTTTLRIQETPDRPAIQYTLVRGLFDLLYERLSQTLNQSPLELDAQQGDHIVRYACALPQLVQYLEAYPDQQLLDKTNLQPVIQTPTKSAFDVLDTICNAYPTLSPDSYALLTSAELQLVMAAVTLRHNRIQPQPDFPNNSMRKLFPPFFASIRTFTTLVQGHTEASMGTREVDPEVLLFEFHARYSWLLSRAAYLLSFHADGRAPIGANALSYLLNSIRKAAQCSDLNDTTYLITHHPQSQTRLAPRICMRILGTGSHYCVDPESIGDEYGLLVGLFRLLGSPEAQSTAELEYAAGAALNTVAPILLKRWMNMDRARDLCSVEQPPQAAFENWPQITPTADWQTALALKIATIIVPYARHEGAKKLPELAISTLYSRLKNDPDRFRANATFNSQADLINQLIALVDTHIEFLSQSALQLFISIFLVDLRDQTYFRWPSIFASEIPAFLRILARIPDSISTLQTLLDVLPGNVLIYPRQLQVFTNSAEGFSQLLKVGKRGEHQLMVAECVTRIIETAADSNNTLAAQAITGLFEAISFALEALPDGTNDTEGLLASMCKLLPLLHCIPHDVKCSIAACPATSAIIQALLKMHKLTEKQAGLLDELQEIYGRSYPDSLPHEGLAQSSIEVQELVV